MFWKKILKIAWKLISNNRGEVDNDGSSGSFQDAISAALDAPEETTAPAEDKKPDSEIKQVEAGEYKGADRRKTYAGEKRRAVDKVDDNPEYEMPFEVEQGKKAKLKLSDLKESAEWINKNKNLLSGALNLQKSVRENPAFGKVLNNVIEKSFGKDGKLDVDFIGKATSFIEGKQEQIKEEIKDKSDDIKDMEVMLEELDPDSSQYKILKRNIETQKQLRKDLVNSTKKLSDFESKINDLQNNQKTFLDKYQRANDDVEVKRISSIFDKEFGVLTSKDKKDGYKFIDDDEQKDFRKAVRDVVASNAERVENDEQFVKLIHDSAKAIYDKYAKRRESTISDYIRTKGKGPQDKQKTELSLDDMEKELKNLDPASEDARKLKEKIKQKKESDEDPLKGRTIGEMIADEMYKE